MTLPRILSKKFFRLLTVLPVLLILPLFSLFSTAAIQTAQAQQAEPLVFLTEHYPPYNFQRDGKLQGISIDLLRAISQQINYPIKPQNMRLMPWTRAYKMATQQANLVLFSTTRTDQREALFHWVGPIAKARVVLLARKQANIHLNSASDISHYRIGAIRDDIAEQQLHNLGVNSGNIHHVSRPESLAKMLQHQRIDLWAYDERVAHWLLNQQGHASSDFEAVYVLKESDLYFAFNKNSDPELIQRFQQGFNQLKQQPGLITQLVAKYLE